MFKSRYRSLMLMAVALAACASAHAMPYNDSGPSRIEQARPVAVKEVSAVAVPAVAVEHFQVVASPEQLALHARPHPDAVELVAVLSVPGFVGLAVPSNAAGVVMEGRCWGESLSTALTSPYSKPGIHAEPGAEGQSPGNAVVYA